MPSARVLALRVLALAHGLQCTAASCVAPSAATEPGPPTPALAVCASYRDSACCSLEDELAFMAVIARSAASPPACRSMMMDLHCAVSCHPNQTTFINATSSTVHICGSFCGDLHRACGEDGGDAVAWCEAIQHRWAAQGYGTVVVADDAAPRGCWGANDGCDGIPNSGLVLDRCGVCGGNASTCAVPGAARSAAIRAQLDSELAAHSASSSSQLQDLRSFTTALGARLADQQARVAASWNRLREGVRSQRDASAAVFDTAAHEASAAAGAVGAALADAKTMSANTLEVLGADVAAGAAAVREEHARAAASHAQHSFLHSALLEREMDQWQASQDEVTATIARLKSQ